MKRIVPVVFLVCFLSCSKKDSQVPAPPKSNCRISSAYYSGGQLSFTYTLSYNADGKISKLTYDGPSAYTKTFAYSGNSIYINFAGVSISATDTITLNSMGRITTHKETVNDTVYNTSFAYGASGQVTSSTSQFAGQAPITTNYVFTNGDLTNAGPGNIRDTTTYLLDRPAVIGNLDDFNQLIYYGSSYYTNAHLKKSYSSWPFHYDYTYTYDDEGKITSVVSNDGTVSESFTFTYECN
jgi:hypothetical protein